MSIISDSVVQAGYAGGANIITADPQFGSLRNYGGNTSAVPLLRAPSAIDAVDEASCPTTDQRGEIRNDLRAIVDAVADV